MGSWLIGRQAVLVLLVGVLTGLVLAGVIASQNGLSGPIAVRAGGLLAASEPVIPDRIDVGIPSPTAPPAIPASVIAPTTSGTATVTTPLPTATPGNVTVVPPPVYSVPATPEPDGGGGSGGGRGRGGGGSGESSGR